MHEGVMFAGYLRHVGGEGELSGATAPGASGPGTMRAGEFKVIRHGSAVDVVESRGVGVCLAHYANPASCLIDYLGPQTDTPLYIANALVTANYLHEP